MLSSVMRTSGSFNMPDEGTHRETRAEIQSGAIRDNIAAIRQWLPPGVIVMAVVKADGYGHGALTSARMAVEGGAAQLAVAYLDEALKLREAGMMQPILVLTPINPCEAELAVRQRLMVTIANAEWFRRLQKHGWPTGKLLVHVKADTGLGRLGFRSKEEWLELAPWLQRNDVCVEGLYTHFATAGSGDTSFLETQYDRFREMLGWCRESGVRPKLRHCAGSAAALRFPEELAMDMVRIGAAMYGFYPENLVPGLKLRPALNLVSRLIAVRRIRRGECLGYDNSYVASEAEWIGTVPIGYADGWSQGLRRAEVLIGGQRSPIVGKICMDQLMVKLPGPCEVGAEVVLIGEQGEARVTAAELAAHLGSVPQEVSSSLSSRVAKIDVHTMV